MTYLDFEKPIEDLHDQLEKMRKIGEGGKVDVGSTVAELERKIDETKKTLYKNLTAWQRVQLSRHPERPYTLYYLAQICERFIELHGDRNVADDKAMIGGLGEIDGMSVMFIGQQKGENTKQRQYRNFGMANPEGYRKALRLMKLAEKFQIPVVTFIDTPGAFPGLEAEERGQGEAIARNLFEMAKLRTPVVCVIIGEGASGGALGIGIGDRVLMLENTWYSVISPESCSSILWHDWNHKEIAAEQLKLTAEKMFDFKLVDGVIPEPLGGAHNDPEGMANVLKQELKKHLAELSTKPLAQLVNERIDKFSKMGVYEEA